MRKEVEAFTAMRYGMFVHYGLFSMLGRGEWVMNREQIAPSEMERLAQEFNPSKFDAEEICRLAVDGGMKYVVLTTMHHEGFRLYDTALTAFNAKAVCGRDLVEEFVSAARRHGLRIGLYHSLNNWHDQPDAVAALESEADYRLFMEHTFARIKELVTHFNPVDILWYDGWWPFDAEGWQAERMNEMVSAIQPHVIFNGRNCLPGDFGTPEQHLSVPDPWRPWEACMTLNDHWGFHISDEEWKSPRAVVKMLLTCANGKGNLLLNIGPRGDGSIPEPSVKIIRKVGEWLANGGREAVTDYKVLERKNGFTYVELYPRTGRTNQLRVHLSWLGYPVLGDWLYKGATADRLMLHARKLDFKHPLTGRKMTFDAPVPPDFLAAWDRVTEKKK